MKTGSEAVAAKTWPATVDITAGELMAAVRTDVHADYYMGLLGAIQDAATTLGCYFAHGSETHHRHTMLPQIKQYLVAAMAEAKVAMEYSGLSPEKRDRLIGDQLETRLWIR